MAGRKRKYTTEVLESIVDEYFNKTAVFGQVSATDIANFAINELGYKDIRYFHFTRNKEIKELISKVNNLYQEGNIENNNVLIEFNPDKFMKTDVLKNLGALYPSYQNGIQSRNYSDTVFHLF